MLKLGTSSKEPRQIVRLFLFVTAVFVLFFILNSKIVLGLFLEREKFYALASSPTDYQLTCTSGNAKGRNKFSSHLVSFKRKNSKYSPLETWIKQQ